MLINSGYEVEYLKNNMCIMINEFVDSYIKINKSNEYIR